MASRSDLIATPYCGKCKRANCGSECPNCGVPFCCEACWETDETHAAMCGALHEEDLVGVSFGSDDLLRIAKTEKEERQLTPDLFPTSVTEEKTLKLLHNINPQSTLNGVIALAPHVALYGVHVSDTFTSGSFFQKAKGFVSRKLTSPIHIEHFGGEVLVLLITDVDLKKWVKKSKTDPQMNATTYARAIKWLNDNPKETKRAVASAAKKLAYKTGR